MMPKCFANQLSTNLHWMVHYLMCPMVEIDFSLTFWVIMDTSCHFGSLFHTLIKTWSFQSLFMIGNCFDGGVCWKMHSAFKGNISEIFGKNETKYDVFATCCYYLCNFAHQSLDVIRWRFRHYWCDGGQHCAWGRWRAFGWKSLQCVWWHSNSTTRLCPWGSSTPFSWQLT